MHMNLMNMIISNCYLKCKARYWPIIPNDSVHFGFIWEFLSDDVWLEASALHSVGVEGQNRVGQQMQILDVEGEREHRRLRLLNSFEIRHNYLKTSKVNFIFHL